MTAERLDASEYNERLYRKLSGYLLQRDRFGIRDTGAPNDGLYYQTAELQISDYLTFTSPYTQLSEYSVQARHRALRLGASAISMLADERITAVLLRPNNFLPPDGESLSMIWEVLVAQGLDMKSQDMVMASPREGVVTDPGSHAISQYAEALPDLTDRTDRTARALGI